jgi:hypothetical protein
MLLCPDLQHDDVPGWCVLPDVLPMVLTPQVLVPKADDEAPSCTVCLCEYEGGDEMRRLPCGHDFHQACIDKWMTQHTTCPICRVGLVPQVGG